MSAIVQKIAPTAVQCGDGLSGGTVADEKTYTQLIEDGKQFVRETLAGLAEELKQPDIDGFKFMVTGRDFDDEKVSIYDPVKRRVVTKLEKHNLADCSTTPSVKRALRSQVEADVGSYLHPFARLISASSATKVSR